MTPPIRWSGDKVVDMQSFMLDRLRGEQVDLKDAANLLISTTRANMMIQTRTHAAAIALLGAEDLEKLIHITCFDLPLLLEVDAVSLCFETGDTGQPGLGSVDIRWFAPGTIDTVLGSREDYAKLQNMLRRWVGFGEAAESFSPPHLLVVRRHTSRRFAGTRLTHTGSLPWRPGNGSVNFSHPGTGKLSSEAFFILLRGPIERILWRKPSN